jgi:7-cyano-7-deazaguanine reductase
MTNTIDSSPLGQKTAYVSRYDPSLLFPIARKESRVALGAWDSLPFYGVDVWTGYEVSWLNSNGKPQVAVAEFSIPCDSPFIIESKSFKLYLNSYNQSVFENFDAVINAMSRDLSLVAGSSITVTLQSLNDTRLLIDCTFESICLDDLDINVTVYQPSANLLTVDSAIVAQEKLHSHLLKSNCPVTGQPDWASVFVEYVGPKINHEGLLKYWISFREHQDFHEHCVERMFIDLMKRCNPDELSVYARYTRRGGLDINPYRSTIANSAPKIGRMLRQ